MKVFLYAGDMNLKRKDEKKYAEIQKFDFFRKQNGENFFLVQMFHSPMGYLASIMFLMSCQYSYSVSKYLNLLPIWIMQKV